jgi:hypothetical protein
MSSQTNQTSSSSAETSFEDSVPVQPMHQGNIRKPWQKKILQEYVCPKMCADRKRGNYASPTDNLMSPCTKKLQAHKKRHYNKSVSRSEVADDRSKPQLLARAFTSVATSKSDTTEGNEENTPPSFQ